MGITYWLESAMVSADLQCLPGNSNTGALAEYLTQGLDSIEKCSAASVITGFLKNCEIPVPVIMLTKRNEYSILDRSVYLLI